MQYYQESVPRARAYSSDDDSADDDGDGYSQRAMPAPMSGHSYAIQQQQKAIAALRGPHNPSGTSGGGCDGHHIGLESRHGLRVRVCDDPKNNRRRTHKEKCSTENA